MKDSHKTARKNLQIAPLKSPPKGDVCGIAADKSISHRSVIFSFLSDKTSRIQNYLLAQDSLDTLRIATQLGARLSAENGESLGVADIAAQKIANFCITPDSRGILEPNDILYCGNAGTAIRLFIGLLAASKGQFILSGDEYLNARPMSRVIAPLRQIGADITARAGDTLAPVCVRGANLGAFCYHSEISSAQVKSALILAALQSKKSETSVFSEVSKSRDHSEKMLLGMGANLKVSANEIAITPSPSPLSPLNITIPADPSSAFYFAILAAISKDSRLCLKNVLLNPTRIEAFKVLQKMGAKVEFIARNSAYEDVGDIVVAGGELVGVEVGENISWLIDEIPALSVAFAFARGKSVVKNAKELRFKESDRIKSTLAGLRAFGVECEEREDGFVVLGRESRGESGAESRDKSGGESSSESSANPRLANAKIPPTIDSHGDHRIAMSFAIMACAFGGTISDCACIDTSFPNFTEILAQFTRLETHNED